MRKVGKSGISSDNFSFRALHQVLDVAHHFRQMGITGKKVIGSWSKARPAKNKYPSCAGDGTRLKKPVPFIDVDRKCYRGELNRRSLYLAV
jgi:hypothetical protein